MKNKLLVGLLVAPLLLVNCGGEKLEAIYAGPSPINLTKLEDLGQITITCKPSIGGLINEITFTTKGDGEKYIIVEPHPDQPAKDGEYLFDVKLNSKVPVTSSTECYVDFSCHGIKTETPVKVTIEAND